MSTSRVLTAGLLLALAGVLAGSFVVGHRPPPGPAAAVAQVEPVATRIEALAVLRGWDDRRARAWALGDVAALRGLYLPGSAAGRRDVAMLRAWVRRGLVVEDLRVQVHRVVVVRRTADRWVLRVTDRLAGGRAAGRRVAALPRDGWSTHLVVLRRVRGEWRVGSAAPVGPAVRPGRSAARR